MVRRNGGSNFAGLGARLKSAGWLWADRPLDLGLGAYWSRNEILAYRPQSFDRLIFWQWIPKISLALPKSLNPLLVLFELELLFDWAIDILYHFKHSHILLINALLFVLLVIILPRGWALALDRWGHSILPKVTFSCNRCRSAVIDRDPIWHLNLWRGHAWVAL